MHPDKEIRRLRIALHNGGMGVILFCCWEILRSIMIIITNYSTDIEGLGLEISGTALLIITIFVMLLVCGISFAIRYYIGSHALRAAKGQHVSGFYLVLAGFLAVFSLLSTIIPMFLGISPEFTINHITALVVEFSSDWILLALVVNALRLKKCEARYAA